MRVENVWVGTDTGQTMRRRAHWTSRAITVFVDMSLAFAATLLFLLPLGGVTHVLSNGRLQGGPAFETCQTLTALPDNSAVPESLRIAQIKQCRESILGFEVGHRLLVRGLDPSPLSTKPRQWTLLLGPQNQIVSGIQLHVLVVPIFWLWRAWADSGGIRTPGRILTRTEVITLRGEKPRFGIALKRQLAYGVILAISALHDVLWSLSGSLIVLDVIVEGLLTLGGAALVLAFVLATVRPLQSGKDTVIDRWLGTTVVMRA